MEDGPRTQQSWVSDRNNGRSCIVASCSRGQIRGQRHDTRDDHKFRFKRGCFGKGGQARQAAGRMIQRAAGWGDVAIGVVREGRSFGCYSAGWEDQHLSVSSLAWLPQRGIQEPVALYRRGRRKPREMKHQLGLWPLICVHLTGPDGVEQSWKAEQAGAGRDGI